MSGYFTDAPEIIFYSQAIEIPIVNCLIALFCAGFITKSVRIFYTYYVRIC